MVSDYDFKLHTSGLGVRRRKRESGENPERSRHCDSERTGRRHRKREGAGER